MLSSFRSSPLIRAGRTQDIANYLKVHLVRDVPQFLTPHYFCNFSIRLGIPIAFSFEKGGSRKFYFLRVHVVTIFLGIAPC